MNDGALEPDDCTTMAEVRIGVDTVDEALCELLGKRFAYMQAAARIKTERSQVRDEARKTQVIENVRLAAALNGWPAELAANLWERLVEASIAYELERWDDAHR
ncbi:chorismate mutase [Sphingomonas sp. ID0503]|uniref:chorismate mutase n=1 Tax=Sphingomonas sp. ID0503 TaxID=3399691 RepID=UPI003AFA9B57